MWCDDWQDLPYCKIYTSILTVDRPNPFLVALLIFSSIIICFQLLSNDLATQRQFSPVFFWLVLIQRRWHLRIRSSSPRSHGWIIVSLSPSSSFRSSTHPVPFLQLPFRSNQDDTPATLIQSQFPLDYPPTLENDYIGTQRQFAGPDAFAADEDNIDAGVGGFAPHLAQQISMPMNNGLLYHVQQPTIQDVP